MSAQARGRAFWHRWVFWHPGTSLGMEVGIPVQFGFFASSLLDITIHCVPPEGQCFHEAIYSTNPFCILSFTLKLASARPVLVQITFVSLALTPDNLGFLMEAFSPEFILTFLCLVVLCL